MKEHYVNICKRTVSYIDNHLSEELSLEKISTAVFCSKYHLHRIFSAIYGQTINQYIVEQRLNRAAYQLVFRREQSITHIGLNTGFANSESFTRAFKRVFTQSPREYRTHPVHKPWLNQKLFEMEYTMNKSEVASNVEIITLDPINLAILTHKGHPDNLHDTLNRFIGWRRSNNLSPEKYRTFNLFHEDPSQVPLEEFSVDLCSQIPDDFDQLDKEMKKAIIPAGRYAKLRHHGKESTLAITIQSLYENWLVQSEETPKDYPLVLERITLFPDVEAVDNIVDIYLALETVE